MANVKITDLTELAAVDLATNDVLPIVDINNDSTKKVTIASLTGLSDANDFITFTRLQANIDVVQDNVASVTVGTAADTETRLNANLNVLDSNADAIETRRVANVTIQTAIEARRVANIAGAVSTITTADLTASRALASDSSGKVAVAPTTLAELNHVSGVSGAVQTQLDAKAALAGATFTGDVTLTNTDGGASASPIIVLDRQSASPADADYLGRIQFKGKDDGAEGKRGEGHTGGLHAEAEVEAAEEELVLLKGAIAVFQRQSIPSTRRHSDPADTLYVPPGMRKVFFDNASTASGTGSACSPLLLDAARSRFVQEWMRRCK